MAVFQNDYAKGIKPMPIADDASIISVRLVIPVTALATNDVIELGYLPEDHVVVDWFLDVDDLDSNGAPTAALDVGLLTAAGTAVSTAAADGGAKWGAALTTAQAGGFVRAASIAAARVQPSPATRRKIGVVASTGSATFQAGTLALTVLYRAANYGA
jgi:hypothetical protein